MLPAVYLASFNQFKVVSRVTLALAASAPLTRRQPAIFKSKLLVRLGARTTEVASRIPLKLKCVRPYSGTVTGRSSDSGVGCSLGGSSQPKTAPITSRSSLASPILHLASGVMWASGLTIPIGLQVGRIQCPCTVVATVCPSRLASVFATVAIEMGRRRASKAGASSALSSEQAARSWPLPLIHMAGPPPWARGPEGRILKLGNLNIRVFYGAGRGCASTLALGGLLRLSSVTVIHSRRCRFRVGRLRAHRGIGRGLRGPLASGLRPASGSVVAVARSNPCAARCAHSG